MLWKVLGVLFVIGLVGAYPAQSLLFVALVLLAFAAYNKWGPTPEQQLATLRARQRLRVSPLPYKQAQRERTHEEVLVHRIAKRQMAKAAAEELELRRREAIAQAERDALVTHDEVLNQLPEHLRKEW